MIMPNPVKYRTLETLKEVDYHRWHNCEYYDICLDAVCYQPWNGWSCRGCEIFCNDRGIDYNSMQVQKIVKRSKNNRWLGKAINGRPAMFKIDIAMQILNSGGDIDDVVAYLVITRNHVRSSLLAYTKKDICTAEDKEFITNLLLKNNRSENGKKTRTEIIRKIKAGKTLDEVIELYKLKRDSFRQWLYKYAAEHEEDREIIKKALFDNIRL
jgi:hypothetical protein